VLLTAPVRTGRLVLRPESLADFEDVFAMHRDPEVMRFVASRAPLRWTREEALERHRTVVETQSRIDFGAVTIVLAESGRYLGWCALAPEPHVGDWEIGFRLARWAWGRSFAVEASREVLRIGFQEKGRSRIVATAHPGNVRSHRVLEKLGMARVGEIAHASYGFDVPLFALERADWLRR
jgi:RimJ/RimL family protein N-acetyltransferase